MKKFSVILLLYNSDNDAIKKTIDSIVCQKDVEAEIILSDDCSKNQCVEYAVEYLKDIGYNNHKVLTHPENVGTTQNIYDALELVSNKYLKCIGAGDLLYSENTLSDIYDFMEAEKCTMCFGKIQAFYVDENGNNCLIPYFLPSDIKAFQKGKADTVKANIIKNHGWIIGASMFYETSGFKKYLAQILDSVRYCEDLLQVTLLLNDEKISLYPKGAVYYEVGSGISTNQSGPSPRLVKDHSKFWSMLIKKYPDNKLVKKGYYMQRLQSINEPLRRKLAIILHNPGYIIMMLKTKAQKKRYEIKEKGILS